MRDNNKSGKTEQGKTKHDIYHERIAEEFDLPTMKDGSYARMMFSAVKGLRDNLEESQVQYLLKRMLQKIESGDPLVKPVKRGRKTKE